jgi:mono/diheme cytochrome c family protein
VKKGTAEGGAMNSTVAKAILAVVIVAAVLAAGIWIGRRPPEPEVQAGAQPGAQAPEDLLAAAPTYAAPERDPYQRSLAIYEFKKAAASGPDRGREIFYYKCWFCHNEYAGPASAPSLVGVFKRGTLLSGRPATEDGIKDEIRNGGAGMAAYKYTLTDADLNDLVAYLKDACCWDSNSPPPNPRYVAGGN